MRLVLTLAAAALLAACSGGGGEPGEADIRTALTQAGNRGGSSATKLACQRGTDKPGFVCDYRAPACNRFTNACGSPKPGSGRFVKSGGRWQLVEDLTPRASNAPGTTPLPGPSAAPTASPTAPSPFPSFSPTQAPTQAPTPQPTRTERPVAPPGAMEDGYRRPSLSPRDVTIIADWIDLNMMCRIDEGADDDAREACRERDRLAQRMRRRGLCYGGGGSETMARWHRCD